MRDVWRCGRKWRTMAANARCTSSTWMAGRFLGVKLRGATTAAAQQFSKRWFFSAWSTSVIWPGSGVAQRCGPADRQLAVADDLPADQRRKLGKSGLHVADSFPG